ncbi:MAG TPA: hypothetical protein VEB70_06050, partial [Noviherbaspirillum sp.]|nr:hypothetical protein [Noviherbaspirillum sp.]
MVFRTLIGVNAAAFAGIMAQAGEWGAGVFEFVEASMVIELSSLWSLFALCGLRQLLLRGPVPGRLPAWPQRAA